MRWNCPHCGTVLAVADEKLGGGWSFSRCYQCSGHALVRKAEVNVIKIDKAPQGEKILLPEATEDPMLSREASERLSQYLDPSPAAKPVIRKAARREERAQEQAPAPAQAALPATFAPSAMGVPLPPPLPEIAPLPVTMGTRLLPIAIGIAGTLAVGSGIYLFVEGQTLWEKARTAAASSPTASRRAIAAASRESFAPAQPMAQAQPAAVAAPVAAAAPNVPASAPAPFAPPPTQHPVAVAMRTEIAPARLVSDEVHNSAMAPTLDDADADPSPSATMSVRLRGSTAKLHAGPGLNYPIIAVAEPDMDYAVLDFSDRWFKVTLPNQQTAWIRNDLVRVVSRR